MFLRPLLDSIGWGRNGAPSTMKSDAAATIMKRTLENALSSQPQSRYLSLDEGEQVGVHDVGMGGAHAVREILVDFQRTILEQLD